MKWRNVLAGLAMAWGIVGLVFALVAIIYLTNPLVAAAVFITLIGLIAGASW